MRVHVYGKKWETVTTLAEASRAVTTYIDAHGMGASRWCGHGGIVVADDGKVIGHVSYNGRVWDEHDNLLAERAA